MNTLNEAINNFSPIKNELAAVLSNMQNKETNGVKELRELLKKSPNNLQIIGTLAWSLAQDEQYEESIALYRRYLQIQPKNVEIRWRIADRLINLGKIDKAYEAYSEVLKEHPNCMDAQMGIRYINYLRKVKKQKNEEKIPINQKLSERQQKNLELNEKEFKEQNIRLKTLPPHLFLEGTKKCNFFCRTCVKGYEPYYAEDLHENIFEQVKRDIMPVNTKISITGFGEPMLSKNFDRILEMSVKNGSFVHFVTNGSLLNFKRIEQLARYPVDVHISMDGATKETFESIRSGSNYEQMMDKLAMIKKLKDIYLSHVNSNFSIGFVALKKNIHELPDLLRMTHHYRLAGIGVLDYAFGYRDFDEQSLRFDPIRANNIMGEAKEIAEKLGIWIELPPFYTPTPPPTLKTPFWEKIKYHKRLFSLPDRFVQRCHSPWMEPYIHNNGTVSPCCTTWKEYLGSIKKNSLEKVWNGWRYRLLRYRIHSPLPPTYCRDCNVCWGINGGNAGNAKAKEGLLVKILYFFEYRFNTVNQKFKNSFNKIAALLKGEKPSPPNYFKGRPISSKNKYE